MFYAAQSILDIFLGVVRMVLGVPRITISEKGGNR